jgi:uncharacterized protein (TIGR02466 family)
MKVDTLFPTTIYVKDCPRLIKESLKITARRICLNEGKNEFQSQCISTIRTNSNILNHPDFFKVRKEITKSIQEYCEYLKLDMSKPFRVRDSWLNYYQPGMYQENHIHHNSLISGVLYILGSGAADFYVSSPLHNQQSILPEFRDKHHSFENHNYETIDGRILMFLSSTLHATRPTDREKISLSFNIDIL